MLVVKIQDPTSTISEAKLLECRGIFAFIPDRSLIFFYQAFGRCIVSSAINDYFLHLVSAAPKKNDLLQELLEGILREWVSFDAGGESKELLQEVGDSLRQVVKCCRGLIALMHPQFGIYGSSSQDVEGISKPKRAKTLKSGSAGPPQTSAETDVMQLVSASDWWQQSLAEFWKSAPKAALLQPKLKAAIAEAAALQFPELTREPWQNFLIFQTQHDI